jgi:hypothetical protein
MKEALLPLASVLWLCPLASAQQLATWDFANTSQIGQATYHNFKPSGGQWGLPVAAGDFNEDGFPDTAIAPFMADSGPAGNRLQGGEVYVWWGNGTIGGVWDGAALSPNRTIFYGAATDDTTGNDLGSGDVNGDGVPDLFIGAQNADGPTGARLGAGAVYVVFGDPGISGNVDLASPPPYVTKLHGRESGDRLGIWSRAGDVDGDGISDLLLGADQADGPGNSRSAAGETYVVFGTASWPASVDLLAPPAGIVVTTVYGIDVNDHSGSTLASGDVDGDGVADLIIGAGLNRAGAAIGGTGAGAGNGPNNSRPNCGEAYVLFGPIAQGATIDLVSPPASAFTVIWGVNGGDYFGEEIRTGDFDGDGIEDLAVGALTADGPGNSRPSAGEAWLLGGGPSLRNVSIDLASPPSAATVIWGAGAGDIAADTLVFSDLNADGLSDLAIGAPQADPAGRSDAGDATVFFGTSAPLPASIDLASPGTALAYAKVLGAEGDDLMGYSMSYVEHDLDGYGDLLPNAMRGDGLANAYLNAGDAYILSGFRLTLAAGLPTPATWTGEPSSGGTLRVNVPAAPGSTVVIALSLATASIPLPPFGTLGLDPSSLFVLQTGPASPSGMKQVVIPVGTVPFPASVFVQALVLASLSPLAGSFTNLLTIPLVP